MKHEKGFYYLDFPAQSGKADSLIVILHGHNNHPKMFESLPAEIHKEQPNADILIIRAPFALNAKPEEKARKGVPDADDLYTWHRLEKRVKPHAALAIRHLFNSVGVVEDLNKFIDHQLKARGLKDSALAFFGFSMGGAIAVEASTRRKEKCASVVCHSGMVLPYLKAKSKPDTLMVMGEKDPLFYTGKLSLPKPQKGGRIKKAFHKAASRVGLHYDDSVRRLKKAGIDVSECIIDDLPHSINKESFDQSLDFIKKRFGK